VRAFLTSVSVASQQVLPAHAPIRERRLLTGRRKIIAERMIRSVREIPHIQLSVDVNMSGAQEQRQEFSVTALITWITARTVLNHPLLNASFEDGAVNIFDPINIGIAVDTDDGLIVPVIHNADTLSLAQTDAVIRELTQQARESALSLDEVSGGTFTISNLGMMSVDRFAAIINPPQSAIMAVGRIRYQPWTIDGTTITVCPVMNVTVSADHRVLDGATVARFLQDFQAHFA
jgi:pyruvate dehydrogenase E2 component (dihydrolipoamide acetyltransferase)